MCLSLWVSAWLHPAGFGSRLEVYPWLCLQHNFQFNSFWITKDTESIRSQSLCPVRGWGFITCGCFHDLSWQQTHRNQNVFNRKVIEAILTKKNGLRQELNLQPKKLDTAPHFPQLPLSSTKSSPISKHRRRDMHMCHLGCKKCPTCPTYPRQMCSVAWCFCFWIARCHARSCHIMPYNATHNMPRHSMPCDAKVC